MTEPYHPFRKRAPSGDDSQDNLCAECGKSPMDGVHNPTRENCLEWRIAEAIALSRRRIVPGGPPPTTAPMSRIQIEGYLGAARAAIEAIKTAAPTQDEPAEGKPPQPPQCV